MSGEFEYEIARYSVHADVEVLIERVQLLYKDGAVWRRLDDEPETRCPEGELSAQIRADPILCEVRADQVTRIIAEPEALRDLPLILQVPGDGSDFDESFWSEAMVKEHLDDSDGANVRGVFRVVYVNDQQWGAFTTSEGESLLPEGGDSGTLPLLTPLWGELSFSEGGALMAVGTDRTAVGPVTPGVAVSTTVPEESDDEISLMRRGDDADLFVDWLLAGTLLETYSTVNPFIDVMMTHLFVDTSVGGCNGRVIVGSHLVPEKEIDEEQAMGTYDSSEWCLMLDLEPAMIERVLDRLAKNGGKFAEIVQAARDPGSPAGIARREALEQRGLT